MTTLQEQFERDFPNKSVRKIDATWRYKNTNYNKLIKLETKIEVNK